MPPVKIDPLPVHTRGDHWDGMIVGPVLINDETPYFNIASCRMQFRDGEGNLGYELNSVPTAGKGTIDLTDPITWLVTLPLQALPLDVGKWYWDFEVTDTDGSVLTLYTGTMKVIGDITYD